MRRAILPFLLLVAPGALVDAQTTAASCDTASTTHSMHTCWGRLAREADSTLQRYLAEARRVAAQKDVFDSAHVAWGRYRDLHCRAAGGQVQGGTLGPVVVVTCLYQVTRARVRDLWDSYLSQVDTHLAPPDSFP